MSNNSILKRIKSDRPLIHCIANIVTANDCANVLLAVGASPTMAHHPMEVAEIAAASGALVLNMGAMECYEAMEIAGLAAAKANKPIVLDPVGASGAAYRREKTLELIENVKPNCIRGNLSEISALAKGMTTSMGVDASRDAKADEGMLIELSNKTGAIIIASGATDYIAYKGQVAAITGGSAIMAGITGAGCMSSCLLGAFLSEEISFDSAVSCVSFINECAEKAEMKTKNNNGGTMTFRTHFIDEVSLKP